MTIEKEIEFEVKLLKSMIKIAKEIIIKGRHPLNFYEEVKDKDTAFALGVLSALKNPYFAFSCQNNFEWVVRKLKEGKSEKEIIEEFKQIIKDKYLHEVMLYGC